MSVNSLGIANALISALDTLDNLSASQIGVPASIGKQVTAWIGLGRRSTTRKTTGTTQQQINFYVCFCYRLDGNESTAETTLLGIVDDFEAALNADLTLGGVVDSLEFSSLSADDPEYQLRAGKEYREYPIVVMCTQNGAYEVKP